MADNQNIFPEEKPENQKNENSTPEEKKKRRFFPGFFRGSGNFFTWSGRALVTLVIVIIASISIFVFLFQTGVIREWTIGIIEGRINNGLRGRIDIEDIKFLTLTKVELINVRIFAAGDTVLYSPAATLDYQWRPLFSQRAYINELFFYKPVIKLLKNRKDIWNFFQIAKPKTDTIETNPLNWRLNIEKLGIVNGFIVLHDSLNRSNPPQGSIDYGNMRIKDVDLILKGQIDFSINDYKIKLWEMRAFEEISGFKIDHFSAQASLDTTHLRANYIYARSGKTHIYGDAALHKINVFDKPKENDFEYADVKAWLRSPNAEPRVFYVFAPTDFTFAQNAAFEVEAVGKLDKLKAEDLYVKVLNSEVELEGGVNNPFDPEILEYYGDFQPSKVYRKDLAAFMPDIPWQHVPVDVMDISMLKGWGTIHEAAATLDINTEKGGVRGRASSHWGTPVVRYAGDLYAQNVNLHALIPQVPGITSITGKVVGNGNQFEVKGALAVKTNVGTVDGDVALNWSKDLLEYNVDAVVGSFNLAPIVENPDLSSSINAHAILKGRGVRLEDLDVNMNIKASRSIIAGVDFNTAIIDGRIYDGGIIKLDDLTIRKYVNPSNPEEEETGGMAYLHAEGFMNMQRPKNPYYNLTADFENVALATILKNENLPSNISGKMDIEGSGLDPEDLEGVYQFDIYEMIYEDRAFLPFDIYAAVSKGENNYKKVFFDSDYIVANLYGNFTYKGLFKALGSQIDYIADFVDDKVSDLTPSGTIIDRVESEKIALKNFDPVDAYFSANIIDLSPLSIFMDSTSASGSMDFNLHINTTETTNRLFIDSITVNNLSYSNPDITIVTDSVNVHGIVENHIENSQVVFDKLDLKLQAYDRIRVNNTLFTNPFLETFFDGDTLFLSSHSMINDSIRYNVSGNFNFPGNTIDFYLDSVLIGFKNSYSWQARKPWEGSISSNGFNIRSISLQRGDRELLEVQGALINDNFENTKLFVKNFNLHDIGDFFPSKRQPQFETLYGNVDSLSFLVNGPMNNPEINIDIKASDIKNNFTYLGNIDANLLHRDSVITGNILFYNLQVNDSSQIENLRVDVNSLPLNLALTKVENRFHKNTPLNIQANADSLPLEMANPFISGISYLQGKARLRFFIEGYLPDSYDYRGRLDFNNAQFIITNTNMPYTASGEVDIQTNKIQVRRFNVRNFRDDYSRGRASITGDLTLEDFKIKNMDFTMTSPGLKVMNDDTRRVMPGLYGDLIVGTGERPLKFFGTLEEPNLTGDINILTARLNLPEMSSSERYYSEFIYEYEGNNVRVSYRRLDSLERNNPDSLRNLNREDIAKTIDLQEFEPTSATGFGDRINYDLRIKFLNDAEVNMDLGTLFDIRARIGTTEEYQFIHFEKKPGEEATVAGAIEVKEGSNLKFIRTLDLSGTISFPEGKLSNPTLDLTAEYDGLSQRDRVSSPYRVVITIRGKQDNPDIDFTYYVNGEVARGDDNAIQENAIFLLATGRTKSEFMTQGVGSDEYLGDLGRSLLSSEASKSLTEALIGTGYIESAEIDLKSGSFEEAKLRLNFQLYKDIRWSIGGNVTDFIANPEVTIEIPLTTLFNIKELENLMLSLTHRASRQNTNPTQNDIIWEAKLRLGFSW